MYQFLMNYSNGWGHLCATCVIVAALTLAFIFGKLDSVFFASIITVVTTFWFGTGIVNSVQHAQAKMIQNAKEVTNGRS